MFLPANVENNIDRTCEKLGSFNENKNYRETSDLNNKERVPREFNPHVTY